MAQQSSDKSVSRHLAVSQRRVNVASPEPSRTLINGEVLATPGDTSGVVLHLCAQLRLQAPLERDPYSEAIVSARLELLLGNRDADDLTGSRSRCSEV